MNAPPAGPAASPPRRRAPWVRWLRYAFLAAVLVALVALLHGQRAEVADALAAIPPSAVVLSLAFGVAGAVVPGLVWRDLLISQGHPTPLGAGLRVFYLAQLGKYLPGGVWNLVAQVDMARDLRVPARQAATATFLSVALSVIAALLVAGFTLPFAVPDLLTRYWWAFLAVPVLLVLLLPGSVAWWSGTAFRVLRRPGEAVRLTWPVLLRATALLLLSWVLLGLHFAVLVRGLDDTAGGSYWLLGTGGFALAWVAGFLFVVAPAGAGVREAALVLGFTAVLPAGAVLTVALLSRVVLVAADVVLAAGFGVAGRRAAREGRAAGAGG